MTVAVLPAPLPPAGYGADVLVVAMLGPVVVTGPVEHSHPGCEHPRRQHSRHGCGWENPDGSNACGCTVAFLDL